MAKFDKFVGKLTRDDQEYKSVTALPAAVSGKAQTVVFGGAYYLIQSIEDGGAAINLGLTGSEAATAYRRFIGVSAPAATPLAGNFDLSVDVSGNPFLVNSQGTVNYFNTGNANMWYGIRRQVGQTSSALTRIGNLDLHKVLGGLPIQQKMRRCVLQANGNVSYYLGATDSTKKADSSAADLTGAVGNIMVEIPDMYIRFWTEEIGATVYNNVAVSMYGLPGFNLVPKHYISAFEASLNRSELKAYSCVNNTAAFRGGNNTAAWDAAANSLLGKPVTNLTRAQERQYASAIGAGWCEEPFEFFGIWRWLAVIEFANTNSQLAVNNTLTVEGYRQGGLGDGITTANSTEWNAFNAYNPFANCGSTVSLGNASGEVSITINDFAGTGVNRTFKANSYRGIENPFGHIWKRLEGININRTSGNVLVYAKKGTSGFVDNTATGYTYIGNMPYVDGYILDQLFGDNGIMLPASVGAGSTTAWADYYYVPGADGWYGTMSSAYAISGTIAGLACVNAAISTSTANAHFGFRLCFKI